jgi:3-oxoacyl-[acyl-carrier protein] reductase
MRPTVAPGRPTRQVAINLTVGERHVPDLPAAGSTAKHEARPALPVLTGARAGGPGPGLCERNGMRSSSTVVVSGAGSGIGKAVACRLADEGMHVTAVGRRRDPLERLAADFGQNLDPLAADVSIEWGAATVAAHIASVGRTCIAAVTAAGGLADIGGTATGLERIRENWQASFESNVLTAVLLVEALREMLEVNGGRVILISSVAALRGSGGGPYGAMKAALHGWVYDLAGELGPHGGTANVVAPGFVPDTEFWAGRLAGDSRRQRAAQTLVGREGTPDEVASLIAWLLSPDGGWMTGQVLSPNGGVVLGR